MLPHRDHEFKKEIITRKDIPEERSESTPPAHSLQLNNYEPMVMCEHLLNDQLELETPQFTR